MPKIFLATHGPRALFNALGTRRARRREVRRKLREAKRKYEPMFSSQIAIFTIFQACDVCTQHRYADR